MSYTETSPLTVVQVAERLNCSVGHVYNLINAGHLAVLRIGKTRGLRIAPEDLALYLEERNA
jgi:excisionase family DNA binding protein